MTQNHDLNDTKMDASGNQSNSSGGYGQPDHNSNHSQNTPKGPNLLHAMLIFFLITFLLNFLFLSNSVDRAVEIPYSQFIALVEHGQVDNVTLGNETIALSPRKDANLHEVEEILHSDGRTDYAPAPAYRSAHTVVRTEYSGLVDCLTESVAPFS